MPLPSTARDIDGFVFKQSMDYVHAVCTKCNESARIEYAGLDPSVPTIRLRCENCVVTSPRLKLWGAEKFGLRTDQGAEFRDRSEVAEAVEG